MPKCFGRFRRFFSTKLGKVVEGQINLRDAVRGDIEYTAPDTGKHYKLGSNPAVLICRVRGLHLKEKHVQFNGRSDSWLTV